MTYIIKAYKPLQNTVTSALFEAEEGILWIPHVFIKKIKFKEGKKRPIRIKVDANFVPSYSKNPNIFEPL